MALLDAVLRPLWDRLWWSTPPSLPITRPTRDALCFGCGWSSLPLLVDRSPIGSCGRISTRVTAPRVRVWPHDLLRTVRCNTVPGPQPTETSAAVAVAASWQGFACVGEAASVSTTRCRPTGAASNPFLSSVSAAPHPFSPPAPKHSTSSCFPLRLFHHPSLSCPGLRPTRPPPADELLFVHSTYLPSALLHRGGCVTGAPPSWPPLLPLRRQPPAAACGCRRRGPAPAAAWRSPPGRPRR